MSYSFDSHLGTFPVCADVAQLVEHHLAKVRVASSNPVVRSEPIGSRRLGPAEWPSGIGKGLPRACTRVRFPPPPRTSSRCTWGD